ncbi:MAG: cytidylate kinase-like family protein [Deltaproteobacteria bacterium]|nr:cytidylate kinase-like family protein [Deltaproteobacteria bacterium]
MSLVTIRGQLGSGAPEIGRQVADLLHADYVDREVIAEVAARLHRQEQDVLEKEMPPSSLLDRIAEALQRSLPFGEGFEGAYLPAWKIPLDDIRYLQTLESVVKDLARNRPLVILGRGSQFILRDYPGVLRVQVVAPLPLRVKRVMEERRIDPEPAKQEIARFDGSSREFVKRYFRVELEDPKYYDLVINTEHLGFQAAASIVVQALSFQDPTSGGQSGPGY